MNSTLDPAKWLRVRVAPARGVRMLLILCAVAAGCGMEPPRTPEVDQANGGVAGTLQSVPKGTLVVLCRIQETSCVPQPNLADSVGGRGAFAVSKVPPGHYVIAYVLPDDLRPATRGFGEGDTLHFTFGSGMNVAGRMQDGRWLLEKDASSDTHLIAAGAELRFADMGLSVANCSAKHLQSGLWMEFRDGQRYESTSVEAGRISKVTLKRWSAR